MSYVVLYFSIGVFLAILVYLYSCYDYRVNFKDVESWERYADNNEIPQFMCGICFAYPFMVFVLILVGLRWGVGYIAKCIREWIFKIIDQHFVK